jgi:hypothetical protein
LIGYRESRGQAERCAGRGLATDAHMQTRKSNAWAATRTRAVGRGRGRAGEEEHERQRTALRSSWQETRGDGPEQRARLEDELEVGSTRAAQERKAEQGGGAKQGKASARALGLQEEAL